MAVVNQKVLGKFPTIKDNIEQSYKNFDSNRERYNDFMRFLFKSTISDQEKATAQELERPLLEFNITEPYVARLLGEFSSNVPDAKVRGVGKEADAATVDAVECILRSIVCEGDNKSFRYNIYKEQLGGGYSVMKVWTEYERESSFDQVIKVGKVYDPTMTGFDPLARKMHKGDGGYCFELYPLTKKDFKERYPKEDADKLFEEHHNEIGPFKWTFIGENKQEVILLADYYEKCKKRYKLHQLADGQVMSDDEYQEMIENWDQFTQPPVATDTRWTSKTIIKRYVITGDRVLETEDTELPGLPLVFVDGNSAYISRTERAITTSQFTRPYVFNARGAQQLKNYAGQSLAHELTTMMQPKYMVDYRSIPKHAMPDWINPQMVSTLLYQSQDDEGNQLPPPIAVNRSNTPPIISETYASMEGTVQQALGSFDTQLINQQQLSGVAIANAATQNNSVAMPYIHHFLEALTHSLQLITDMIPLYYVTPRTIPVVTKDGKNAYMQVNQQNPDGSPMQDSPQLNYENGILNVSVEAGMSFELQKQKALEMLTQLANAFPAAGEMLNQGGLPVIMKNIDIRGQQQLVDMAEEFTEQQKEMQAQQGQKPNPQAMALQQQAQLKQQELQLKAQKQAQDIQIQQANLQLEQQKLENERLRLVMQQKQSNQDAYVQLDKANTEKEAKAMELAMSQDDQAHRHAKDFFEISKPKEGQNEESNNI